MLKKIMCRNSLIAALLSTGYLIFLLNGNVETFGLVKNNLIFEIFFLLAYNSLLMAICVSSWIMYFTKVSIFGLFLNIFWVFLLFACRLIFNSIDIYYELLFFIIVIILQIIEYKQDLSKKKILEEKIAKGEIVAPKFEKVNLLTSIIFSIITNGLYNLLWMSYITEDVNIMESDGKRIYPIISCILFVSTYGLYSFYWIYEVGKKIQNIKLKNNLPVTNNMYLYFILLVFGILVRVTFDKINIFLSITVLLCFIQNDLNNIAKKINDKES